MNVSIKMNSECELINLRRAQNPLISKCQIKVCYVGENRNGTVISKAVATEMANSLPGCPIVGYYNAEKQDFEGHNRELEIIDDELQLVDTTKAYGFVDLYADAWFEWYQDNGVPHEYLVTEGWLWTGQYPEAQRIIEKGNNQSMELDSNSVDGYWTIPDNNKVSFFIINEALISKLCVLGEDVEPCFEGASVTAPVTFSLQDDFKEKIYALRDEVEKIIDSAVEEPIVEEPVVDPESSEEKEPVLENEVHEDENINNVEEPEESAEEESEVKPEENEEPVLENSAVTEEQPEEEESTTTENVEENPENLGNSQQYNLDDIQEYTELLATYNTLKENYEALQSDYAAVVDENSKLAEFKKGVDKVKKQEMIDSFSMLSASETADVIANIDNYSLEEIESKLSIIYSRKQRQMNALLENDKKEVQPVSNTTFSLEHSEDSMIPAWIKALKA